MELSKKVKSIARLAVAFAFLFLVTSCMNPVNSGGGLFGQGVELSLTGKVTTLAGMRDDGFSDGLGTAAKFSSPCGMATDGANLYVADRANHMIRKVVIATGEVTTLAGSATAGYADGVGKAARFSNPIGIAINGSDLYVADTGNNMIRKIVIATGEVTTLAGSVTVGYTDGIGSSARFFYPYGITTDGTNLYVADSGNNMIRTVAIATGEVATLAGSTTPGFANGLGPAARFNSPTGITTDGRNLYIADTGSSMIRKVVIATGKVTLFVGDLPGSSDGGRYIASFNNPYGIATDGTNLYVADTQNNMIRKIVIRTAFVTTIAGSTSFGYADGTGTSARFFGLMGIATDGVNLYAADTGNNMIRRVE